MPLSVGFQRWMRSILGLVAATALLSFHAASAQDRSCAMVLLHGKWGTPQVISSFGRKLDPPCEFKAMEMPWASRRAYDEPYDKALAEVGAQVKAFRTQGYRRVVVAGQSLGANAVIAYLAEGGDADAAIVLAPGHAPRFWYESGATKEAVDKARELVAAGKGSETVAIDDINQREKRSMHMRADVLLSYFEPLGLGDIATTSGKVKQSLPVLWVLPSADPTAALGAGYAFDKLPPHPKSRFMEIQSSHLNTPDAAAATALEWVKAVL